MLKRLLLAPINLLLYGHFWIATAALAMTGVSKYLLVGEWRLSALDGFIASGTLTIYALHRMVALHLQTGAEHKSRYRIMYNFRWHIWGYAVLAAGLAAIFYWHLPFYLQLGLLVPCGIALAYVIPFLNGKRLRDLPYIKIFLIAISWAWLTVVGPAMELDSSINWLLFALVLERACFIFAITIPFDIRDLILDKEVPTIPGTFGTQPAQRSAYLALGTGLGLLAVLVVFQILPLVILLPYAISYLSTAYLIWLSTPARHDYFFTGLMDGTMILQGVLVMSLGSFPLPYG